MSVRQALKEQYMNNLRCNRRQGCLIDYELRRSDTFSTGVPGGVFFSLEILFTFDNQNHQNEAQLGSGIQDQDQSSRPLLSHSGKFHTFLFWQGWKTMIRSKQTPVQIFCILNINHFKYYSLYILFISIIIHFKY